MNIPQTIFNKNSIYQIHSLDFMQNAENDLQMRVEGKYSSDKELSVKDLRVYESMPSEFKVEILKLMEMHVNNFYRRMKLKVYGNERNYVERHFFVNSTIESNFYDFCVDDDEYFHGFTFNLNKNNPFINLNNLRIKGYEGEENSVSIRFIELRNIVNEFSEKIKSHIHILESENTHKDINEPYVAIAA